MTHFTGAERTRKYRVLSRGLVLGNAVLRWQLEHAVAPNAFALVETIGRRSGRPRRTCVGDGLIGDTFWVVAAHGHQADWIRNVEHTPHVRVLTHRQWRTGVAHLLPDDDPDTRSRRLPHQWDAAIGRLIATTPLSVRIDLTPQP